MTDSVDQVVAGRACDAAGAIERQLIVGTLESLPGAARTLDDLQRAGFAHSEITLVAPVAGGRQVEAAIARQLDPLGQPSTVMCRGLGTLLIGGWAVPALRALGTQVSFDGLGRAFADAGLPDADALIYELGLIRGQCLLAVRATTVERGQVAYRLLLRCGSREIHVYRD
jgi:hypothetical protein